jgi:citrate synthase
VPSESSLYLTAEEAAEMMGVAVPSLYAYVGRKGIRSQPIPGQRARLYWREDVEKIANRKSKASVVNWDSVLVPQTKITLITDEGPFYRGHSAVLLAEKANLEDVAALLWEQDKASLFPNTTPSLPESIRRARAALAGMSASEKIGSLLTLLEHSNPRNYDRTAAGFFRAGGDLLRWFAALAIGAARPSTEPVHLVLARGWKASKRFDDMIRRILVLLADHELTADTYAVRAVANAGCTPHQAVMAGIVATGGYRLGQSKGPSLRRLIEEIVANEDPGQPLIDRYREGEPIPGFEGGPIGGVSTGVNAGRDARAASLLETLDDQFSDDQDVRRLLKAVEVAREGIGVEPNIRLVYFFMERKLKISPSDASLKVVARIVGWLAHAFEQMESGPLVRPRTAYAGPLPNHP